MGAAFGSETAGKVFRGVPSRACDGLSADEWRCGCKKFGAAGESSSPIEYDAEVSRPPPRTPAIPRVVHFISRILSDAEDEDAAAGDEWCVDFPCEYVQYARKYLDLEGVVGGDFEFHLHCREEIEGLLGMASPSLLSIYQSLPTDIQVSR